MEFQPGDLVQHSKSQIKYIIHEIRDQGGELIGSFVGYPNWYCLRFYVLVKKASEIEVKPKTECTCTSRQIFDFGCRCGFQKPYQSEWCCGIS